MIRRPPRSTRTDTLFPYTTLFRSWAQVALGLRPLARIQTALDRLRRSPSERLAAEGPAEVQPLIDAINALADVREADLDRSEERRVGKECVSTCRSRWSPYH